MEMELGEFKGYEKKGEKIGVFPSRSILKENKEDV